MDVASTSQKKCRFLSQLYRWRALCNRLEQVEGVKIANKLVRACGALLRLAARSYRRHTPCLRFNSLLTSWATIILPKLSHSHNHNRFNPRRLAAQLVTRRLVERRVVMRRLAAQLVTRRLVERRVVMRRLVAQRVARTLAARAAGSPATRSETKRSMKRTARLLRTTRTCNHARRQRLVTCRGLPPHWERRRGFLLAASASASRVRRHSMVLTTWAACSRDGAHWQWHAALRMGTWEAWMVPCDAWCSSSPGTWRLHRRRLTDVERRRRTLLLLAGGQARCRRSP